MKSSNIIPVLTGIGLLICLAAPACKKNPPASEVPQIQTSNWIYPGSNGLQWKKTDLPVIGKALTLTVPDALLTEESIKNSILLVYAKLNGYSPAIWPTGKVVLMRTMVTYKLGNNSRTDVWSALPKPGELNILLTNPDNEYDPWGESNLHSFRYIIVPKYDPSITGRKPAEGSSNLLSRFSETDLRNMSYEQLCEIAGLPK